MNDKTLKVLCALATGSAIAASMNTVAFADPTGTPASSYTSTVTGSVIADVLNIRSNPNTTSSIIGGLNRNTKVSIVEISNGWYKISHNNTTGWISGEYVKLDSSSAVESASTTAGIVNANVLNVRSGPSTSSKIVGSLGNNAKVEIISTTNGWHKIKYNNSTSYVSAEYVTLSATSNANTTNNNNDTSQKPTNGVVTADALNVRSGAGTSAGIIGSLGKNAKVEIISTSNGWHKIKYKNSTGFISADFVTISGTSDSDEDSRPSRGTPPPTSEETPSYAVQGKIAVVNADVLNVRSGAGTNYAVSTVARYGSKLPIISYTNGWYNVKVGNIVGYISGDYVSVTDESQGSTPLVRETALVESNYTGEDIVAKAKEYLGVPYLWGGFTPVGFDCSGIVQYVYKQLGISLERTTYYQVHQGVVVGRNELRPGDLLFFTTNDDDPTDISHVGIYTGNDMFIQAPKPGDSVRISNLNSAYYSNRYYVAKRIIK